MKFEVDDPVIIYNRPTDVEGAGVIGKVTLVMAGSALGGRDVAVVSHRDPFDGVRYQTKFVAEHLGPPSAEIYQHMARAHEMLARELHLLAKAAR